MDRKKRMMKIAIILIILVISSAFILLFSKKIHKIEFIENLKSSISEISTTNSENLEESQVPDFTLTTTVNLEAANGHGGVDLDWSSYDATGKIFKAYQKKEGSDEYESISTVNFYDTEMEPIKVLNVYPVSAKTEYGVRIPHNVTFTYQNGKTEILPMSAMLKVWVEGGKINSEVFENYAKNPITGQNLLDITPVSSNNFNLNPEMIWDYDIVMFGIWDANGGEKDQPTGIAIETIEKYIKSGYGVLAGHDSIVGYYPNGLSKLRKYFNIEIGNNTMNDSIDYNTTWLYYSSKVEVKKSGLITNFPYELPIGTKLTIPITHPSYQAAKGNVWMTLVDGYNDSTGNYYNAGGTGDATFYLTTWNNTAMIQAGSTNETGARATADERKVLTNTLFYLKQITKSTSFTDSSSQDLKAPNAPTIIAKKNNKKKEIELKFSSEDNGSTYSFYIEAFNQDDTSKVIATSNTTTETVTTGTKGYYYIIDTDSSNKDFDISTATYIENNSAIIGMEDSEKYVHVKAVDTAGNISEQAVIKIDAIEILELTSKVNLELAAGRGGVELDWKGYDIANKYFVIYRKEEGEETFKKIVDLNDKLCADEYTDILGNDIAKPIAPTVDVGTTTSDIKVDFFSSDNGTTYIYYVEAYDSTTNEILATSNTQVVKI